MHRSEEMLSKTQFVCEATLFEEGILWQKFSTEAVDTLLSLHTKKYGDRRKTYKWRRGNPGYLITVGRILDFPVNINCRWVYMDDVLIMFYDAVSRVVDTEMIDEWLKLNCNPQWDKGRRRAHTNPDNFHLILEYLDDPERR